MFHVNFNMPTLFAFFVMINLFAPLAKCGWRSSVVVNGPGPSASEWLAMSGARLRGRLAFVGFETLLASMILSAWQRKGHPSSWRGLPLRRGRSSWMVRVWE